MPALRELQLAFVAAMFGESDEVSAHVRENGMSAEARLGIYQNNLREGFIKALALGFPVIERLSGTDYFRQLALEFLGAHPSRSGNLHHIGAPFAPFLARKFEGTQYAYFADVAALEWAYEEAQLAADADTDVLSAEAFAGVASEDYERLTFEFHPACRFVQSRYPIVKIWRANQPEASGDEVIDLASGGDNVLVLRTPECVEFHSLPAVCFALFEALARGETLGSAVDSAAESAVDSAAGSAVDSALGSAVGSTPDCVPAAACAHRTDGASANETAFDLGAALRHLLELRILTALRVSDALRSQPDAE